MNQNHLFVILGVVVGQILFRGTAAILRRTGHAARIDAWLTESIDHGMEVAVDLVRSEAVAMLVWVALTVVAASAFLIGMSR